MTHADSSAPAFLSRPSANQVHCELISGGEPNVA
jgi:hypothetical protein